MLLGQGVLRLAVRRFSTLELEERLKQVEGTRRHAREIYVSLLRGCLSLTDVRRVHHHLTVTNFCIDRFMKNVLIEMYSKLGSLVESRAVFESIHEGANVFSWTLLIAAYDRNGHPGVAWGLFNKMELEGIKPREPTLVVLAGVLSKLGAPAITAARQLHSRCDAQGLLAWDFVLGTALFNMFSKLGCAEETIELFQRLEHAGLNTVSSTAIIAACVQAGDSTQALSFYKRMISEGIPPDNVTFLVVIGACADTDPEFLPVVESQVTEHGMESDSLIGSALVAAYGKQGKVGDAVRAFQRIRRKGLSAWNSMLVIYSRNGQDEEAVELYREMKNAGAESVGDEITYSSVLSSCTESFQDGKMVFQDAKLRGYHRHFQVRSAAINIHARFGDLVGARTVFDGERNCRSLSCWNALIGAYAQHGDGGEVIELWFRMRLEGVDPDETTLVSVMCGCSHCGMMEQGVECCMSMVSDYSTELNSKHLRCIVDLVGRAGQIEKAHRIVRCLGIQTGEVERNMLLAACMNQDVDMGMP